MTYYIITYKLAKQLGCIGQRFGSQEDGYLVNSADLNVSTVAENATEVRDVSLEDAKIFAQRHNL